MENIIEELKWRGLVQDIIPGTEEQLCKESTSGYVGYDPTADSLHIGSLILFWRRPGWGRHRCVD